MRRSRTSGAASGPARSAGFSLIEVLVAFTVLALSLGALYQVFGQGIRAADLGDDYTRAVMHARSQLARLGVEEPPDEAAMAGELPEGYRWEAELVPYLPREAEAPLTETGLEPLLVRVSVHWESAGRERRVELETVRLKVPAP